MVNHFTPFTRSLSMAALAVGCAISSVQADPLRSGWALDSSASRVTFESEHSGGVVETHAFDAYRGVIDVSGAAILKVRLASVDTQKDLRDVRLRFLFFETFKFPEATIRAQIERDDLFALEKERQKIMTLPISLDLHGRTQEMSAEVVAALNENNTVSVSSVAPIMVRPDEFDLMDGLERLEDAFYGEIRPEFPVSFNFVFRPYETDLPMLVATTDVTPEACETRLSEAATAGQVQFQKGSYEVADSSKPALERVYQVVNACAGLTITVEGHTDSVGKKTANQSLSERRAASVARYLVKMGLPENRVSARGRGESAPIAPNDTPDNRAKNRRIEFHVDQLDLQG